MDSPTPPPKRSFSIEVALEDVPNTLPSDIQKRLLKHFSFIGFIEPTTVPLDSLDKRLQPLIHHLHIEETSPHPSHHPCPLHSADLHFHIHPLHQDPPEEEYTEESEENPLPSLHQWQLPNKEFLHSWQSLHYQTPLKQHTLNYANTTLLFAKKKINNKVISWNKLLLFHGPPGTGKTTLAKAIAQKLSITLSSQYPNSLLLEINAHSLFSKYFSESGKLVLRLFSRIKEILEDTSTLVLLLIDEVESLTASRAGANEGDPVDQTRVVNAVLTNLDSLRVYPNVLIMSTSNVCDSIDGAFLDRADMKVLVPLPGVRTRYDILLSCVKELCGCGVIEGVTEEGLEMMGRSGVEGEEDVEEEGWRGKLWNAAKASNGFSGRALRKIPIQAHALFIAKSDGVTMDDFLDALILACEHEQQTKKEVKINHLKSTPTPPEDAPLNKRPRQD